MTSGYDYLIKILLVGNTGVGKSALVNKYTDNEFDEKYISTIGVDFKVKTIVINSKTVKLQMWDTAGQERFRTITSSYYRGAHGILVVYDITNKESFDSIINWLSEIEQFSKHKPAIICIGNKNDLPNREVSKKTAETFLKTINIDYYETSAKTRLNLNDIFEDLACKSIASDAYMSRQHKNEKISFYSKSQNKLGFNCC